jgi:hypothetical protein
MDIVHDYLSRCTLQEVLELERENHARFGDIRKQIRTLVERRLAKAISLEEYTAGRELANLIEIQCKNRHSVLNAEIIRRRMYARQRRAERLSTMLPRLRAGAAV